MSDLHQSFQDIKAAGPPVKPLDFPTPVIHPAVFVPMQTVINHNHSRCSTEALLHHDVRLLCRTISSGLDTAYWMKKPISRTTYGTIQFCVVVRRRCSSSLHHLHEKAEWITTDETVAIKVSSMTSIRNCGEFMNVDGPLKEAACLQLIGNYHPNILGCIEVLHDDNYLYTVLPYCPGGSFNSIMPSSLDRRRSSRNRGRLYGSTSPGQPSISSTNDATAITSSPSSYAVLDTPSSDRTVRTVSTDGTLSMEDAMSTSWLDQDGERIPNEPQIRIWFMQLLEALQHLQKKGVCHRNINSSNILIESRDSNNIVLIDFASALRVPYKDDSNIGCVADVSQGTDRLLIYDDHLKHSSNTSVRNDSRSRHPHLHRNAEPSTYQKKSTRKSDLTTNWTPYTAPELLDGQPFGGFAVDLWSAGVFLYVMLVGAIPFQTANVHFDHRYREVNHGQLREMILGTRTIVSDNAIDLIQNMLWHDPQKRLTLNEVLLHPWITSNRSDADVARTSSYGTASARTVRHSYAMQNSFTPPRWYTTRRGFNSSMRESTTLKTIKKKKQEAWASK